ncbi:MAG: dephospho-CoA kinase [Cellulosilyticaceae bacterium]
MKIIGIIGGSGAGKSTIVSLIESLVSCHVIGADEVGHVLLSKTGEAYTPIIEEFGVDILDEERHINRKKLGSIVFSSKESLERLNKLTHPLIYKEIKTRIEQLKANNEYSYVIIDAALLIEIGLIKLCDVVIGVYADEKTRMLRIVERDNITEDEAYKRIEKQKKWQELEKESHFVINNTESYEDVKKQLEIILKKF